MEKITLQEARKQSKYYERLVRMADSVAYQPQDLAHYWELLKFYNQIIIKQVNGLVTKPLEVVRLKPLGACRMKMMNNY